MFGMNAEIEPGPPSHLVRSTFLPRVRSQTYQSPTVLLDVAKRGKYNFILNFTLFIKIEIHASEITMSEAPPCDKKTTKHNAMAKHQRNDVTLMSNLNSEKYTIK